MDIAEHTILSNAAQYADAMGDGPDPTKGLSLFSEAQRFHLGFCLGYTVYATVRHLFNAFTVISFANLSPFSHAVPSPGSGSLNQ